MEGKEEEGRKGGRKEERIEGRKEGREEREKEGSLLQCSMMFICDILASLILYVTIKQGMHCAWLHPD